MNERVTVKQLLVLIVLFSVGQTIGLAAWNVMHPATPTRHRYTLHCADGAAGSAEINGVTVHCGETVVVDQ